MAPRMRGFSVVWNTSQLSTSDYYSLKIGQNGHLVAGFRVPWSRLLYYLASVNLGTRSHGMINFLHWIDLHATALGIIPSLLAVVVASILLYINFQQQKSSQESYLDQQRPILAPNSRLSSSDQISWDAEQQTLHIKNYGAGVALNIKAVLFERMPKDDINYIGRRYTAWHNQPLGAKEETSYRMSPGQTDMPGTYTIESETFYAPMQPPLGAILSYDATTIEARLTVTYHDVFGRKHISMFDYTQQHEWRMIMIESNIAKDIQDIDKEVRLARIAHQRALQDEVAR